MTLVPHATPRSVRSGRYMHYQAEPFLSAMDAGKLSNTNVRLTQKGPQKPPYGPFVHNLLPFLNNVMVCLLAHCAVCLQCILTAIQECIAGIAKWRCPLAPVPASGCLAWGKHTRPAWGGLRKTATHWQHAIPVVRLVRLPLCGHCMVTVRPPCGHWSQTDDMAATRRGQV